MKFNYEKLERYNRHVSQHRKYIKLLGGIFGYIVLLFVFDSLSGPSKANLVRSNNSDIKVDAVPMEAFAVWTYPFPPPKDELDKSKNERLYCSYSPCAPVKEETDYYPEPYILNLGNFVHVSKKFDTFIQYHAWYKFLHGAHFPHHVQSVAILSIIKTHPGACVRTLGQDKDHTVCTGDFKTFKDYDPTDANSIPPFAVQYMDMPDRYGILDYQSHMEERKTASLEDEMQSLASLQFLPYLTDLVDSTYGIPKFKGHLIMNAWYGADIAFPPNEKATVTMTSMHIDDGMKAVVENNIDFFRNYNSNVGAIGATDAPTLNYLRKVGLSAYFSSSFTSMMDLSDNRSEETKERTSILVVDYDDDIQQGLVPEDIMARATHINTIVVSSDSHTRFKQSFELTKQIAEAKTVICFKIQTAFLAMANGANTILVGDISKMDTQTHGNGHMFQR